MFEALAQRADEVLEQFTPQGLANLAWGMTVAACYPPQVRLGACPPLSLGLWGRRRPPCAVF